MRAGGHLTDSQSSGYVSANLLQEKNPVSYEIEFFHGAVIIL